MFGLIDVIHEEATEDIHRLGGVSDDETIFDPAGKVVRRRLFWLLVNLPTAVLAATVVGLFEPSIQALAALAVFMPIVAGMGGNAGIQTFTVIVRAMALGDLTLVNTRKVLPREAMIGLANGAGTGLVRVPRRSDEMLERVRHRLEEGHKNHGRKPGRGDGCAGGARKSRANRFVRTVSAGSRGGPILHRVRIGRFTHLLSRHHRYCFSARDFDRRGTSRLLKNAIYRLLKKIQRRGARKIDERRRTYPVRCSEAIERNEVYEAFSAACYGSSSNSRP